MKKYLFSMQRILEAREAQEKGRQIELAKINQQVELAKKELQSLRRVRSTEVEDIVKAQRLSGSGGELASLVAYLDALDGRIDSCDTRIQELRVDLSEARAALSSAAKERKVLEKLSDKEKQEWLKDCNRLEQKSIDESASAGVFRRIHAV